MSRPADANPVDANPVDAYLERFEGEARAALDKLRDLLRDAVPGATETMLYGIPTLDLHVPRSRHVRTESATLYVRRSMWRRSSRSAWTSA